CVVPPLPGPALLPYTTLFRSARPVGPGTGTVERAAPGPGRADRAVDRRGADHRGRDRAAAVDPAAPAPRPGHRLQRAGDRHGDGDRKSTRLNSRHVKISYAVF